MSISGSEAARLMLEAEGLLDVAVMSTGARGRDSYEPERRAVCLGDGAYLGRSVSAVSVACHECGHAAQRAERSAMSSVHDALEGPADACARSWVVVLIAGVVLGSDPVCWAALALWAAATLMQIAQLPAELDATRRAVAFMRSKQQEIGLCGKGVSRAARVLQASALTYLTTPLLGLTGPFVGHRES